MAGFNATMLGNILVPYPENKKTQQDIVNKIFGRVYNVVRVANSIETQCEAVDALPTAILRQAFSIN